MATMEDAVAAMQIEIDTVKEQLQNTLTRQQGEQIIQDANARELAHLQKANEREEKMRRHEGEVQHMNEAMEGLKERMTKAEAKTNYERKCIGYINMKNKEPNIF